MKLTDVQSGSFAEIVSVDSADKVLYKLLDMGFVRGAKVEIIREAPLYDPIELKIQDYNVSIRRSEAALIEVKSI